MCHLFNCAPAAGSASTGLSAEGAADQLFWGQLSWRHTRTRRTRKFEQEEEEEMHGEVEEVEKAEEVEDGGEEGR